MTAMAISARLSPTTVNELQFLVDERARSRGILIAFSRRTGGFSSAPFDSLNLALRVGDDRAPVEANRRLVAAAAGFSLADLALARQVHGATLMEVRPGQSGVLGEADGLFARDPGPVLGILTADCAPVILEGQKGVAVLHAGWRGVVAGVIEAGIAEVGPVRSAWVGPSIHSCCYVVGPEVIESWHRRGLPIDGDRVDPGRSAATILATAGVPEVIVSDDCTSCSRGYFSYRRDGVTGRQGAFVALLEDTVR
jgi:polyphenol oxidase